MPRLVLNVRLVAVVAFAFLVVVGWLVYVTVRFQVQELRIRFAKEQIGFFQDMAFRATAEKTPREVRRIKEFIESYYPSGTKQTKGSDLDTIVEIARRDACRRIEVHSSHLKEPPSATQGVDAKGSALP